MGTMDSLLAVVMLLSIVEKGVALTHVKDLTYFAPRDRQDAVMSLPKNREMAIKQNFIQIVLEKEFCFHMELWCMCDDIRTCLFFDNMGHMCGVQYSYPMKDLEHIPRSVYNFDSHNFMKTNFTGVPAYSLRIFFLHPEELTAVHDDDSHALIEGLWIYVDGELLRFDSKCQPNAPVIYPGEFVMLGCTTGIGQVFVRQFDEAHSCRDGFFLYLLYEDGQLVGFGHGIPGIVEPGPVLDLYHHPHGHPLRELAQNVPSCYYDLEEYGFTAMTIYLVKDPWNIRCPKCLCGHDSNKIY